jgi:hypothetical protein
MLCIQETLLTIQNSALSAAPMSNKAKGKQRAITTSSRSRSPDRPHAQTSLPPIMEEREWERSQSSTPGRDGTAGPSAHGSPRFTESDINKIIRGTSCSVTPRTRIYALVRLINFFFSRYGWLMKSTAEDTCKAPPTATGNSTSNRVEKTNYAYRR